LFVIKFFQVKLGWHYILGTPYVLHVTYLYCIIIKYFSINNILTDINNTRLQISFKEITHGCRLKNMFQVKHIIF